MDGARDGPPLMEPLAPARRQRPLQRLDALLAAAHFLSTALNWTAVGLAPLRGDRSPAALVAWAAERGDPYTQLMLGRYLAHGLAGPTDLVKAQRILKAAQAAMID